MDTKQQYIYVIEANITLQNGLNIPLMTEYLHRDNNQLTQPDGKQDSGTTAFERLAKRLKQYFPRLKMIFFMDAMYATQPVMEILHNHHWEYIIRLPKKKLTDLAERLNKKKDTRQSIPEQPAYRKRKQTFYWE
jgi:DNA phosphorothioation-dependent restriction protein DptG